MGTRRRLSVNVSEELAVEALAFRLEAVLRGSLNRLRNARSSPYTSAEWRGRSRLPRARRNPFGVRLYLAFAFAGVALITAGIVYLLVSETGTEEADERLDELASGRTIALANEVEDVGPGKAQDTLDVAAQEDFSAWVYDASGNLITASTSQGFDVDDVEDGRRAVAAALDGRRLRRAAHRRHDGGRDAGHAATASSTAWCWRAPSARPSSRRRSTPSAATGSPPSSWRWSSPLRSRS